MTSSRTSTSTGSRRSRPPTTSPTSTPSDDRPGRHPTGRGPGLSGRARRLCDVRAGSDERGAGATPDGETTAEGNPAVGDAAQLGDLSLASPAFADGETIPRRFGRDGDNVNPPLRIDGVPDGAASLALVLDDPDAPGGTFLHWLLWNVDPGVREIPDGWSPAAATVGANDFGNRRYDGPDPPDGPHTYRFKLYAVGSTLDLDPPGSVRNLGRAISGDLLGRTQLRGEYAP